MAVPNITALPGGLGNLAQIAFNSGVIRQLSQDQSDFKVVQMHRVGVPQGRELRFMLMTGGGPGAIQASSVGEYAGAFPASQRVTVEEKSTVFKAIDATIEISEQLAQRLKLSADIKYAEQLSLELESKINYAQRRVGADLHLDGTGVMGTAASAVDTTGAGGSVLITLSTAVSARGHVNVFEYGDLVTVYAVGGTVVAPSVVGSFYAYEVLDVLRESNQVRLAPVNASYARLSLTASSAVAGNVIYRIGQPTKLDLTQPIGDYGTATEICVGLESLIADDGRLVNGMTMSGVLRSIVRDKSGEVADIRHLTELVGALRNRNGQRSGYRWEKVLCASEYLDTQAEAWRQDRRFSSSGDGVLGAPALTYQHADIKLSFYVSEFARKDRQWLIPSGGATGKAPVQFRFSDFKAAEAPDGGSKWNRNRGTSGEALKAWSQYLCAHIGAYNLAPAACGVIKGASVGI
jgi:hypothetical protein